MKKKKDLVYTLLADYRGEFELVLFWHDEMISNPKFKGIYDEHCAKKQCLMKILLSYGYTIDELVQIEFSSRPISEFIK